MNKIRFVLVAAISGAAGAVIFQNSGVVKAQVLFTSYEVPLIFLLGGMAVAGFVVGYLVSLVTRSVKKD